jgi:hypothetical protein
MAKRKLKVTNQYKLDMKDVAKAQLFMSFVVTAIRKQLLKQRLKGRQM